jgi:methionyl-tRNA formyltransferase
VRLAYYGTPNAAVPSLERLVSDGRAPILVVTRRDRPRGRGLAASPSPVRAAAERLGLPVATPARAGDPEEIERLRALEPDLFVVVAYGQIFPSELLHVPRLGALNVHFSLLPRHRGASPVQAALLAGDRETGVTVQWMTEGLDEGPVAARRIVPIEDAEDAGALGARLAAIGAEALSAAVATLAAGRVLPREAQDPGRATYAPRIPRDAGRLTLALSAEEIVRRVRGYSPDPGAFFEMPGGRLLVARAATQEAEPPRSVPPSPGDEPRATGASAGSPVRPGTILAVDRERGVLVALREGAIRLVRVRPSGRREMAAADFVNGARLKPGDHLDLSNEEPVKAHGGSAAGKTP